MPPRKTKKPTPPPALQTTLRLTPAELAPIEADRAAMSEGGVPIKMGAYLKHAAMSYARLRKLEARMLATGDGEP